MFADERLEFLENSFALLRVKSGSDLARMLQSFTFIHTEYERPEVFALAFNETGDHKLLLLLNLHFQPAFRPRCFVRASPIFSDDALNAHLLNGFENGVRLGSEMLRVTHDIVPLNAFL